MVQSLKNHCGKFRFWKRAFQTNSATQRQPCKGKRRKTVPGRLELMALDDLVTLQHKITSIKQLEMVKCSTSPDRKFNFCIFCNCFLILGKLKQRNPCRFLSPHNFYKYTLPDHSKCILFLIECLYNCLKVSTDWAFKCAGRSEESSYLACILKDMNQL